jgi:predicted porin
MKKKALALAVAGALGAPALAYAQASTVQVYGQIRIDYNYIDQGAGLKKLDAFSTYDSYIGFRGEEKLGGGLSAWFQCESTIAGTGEEAHDNGFCTRNTGVGFKGAWGNVFFGNWDTPYKIVHGSVYRPFSTSGSFGNSSLLHNESAGHAGNGLMGAAGNIGSSGAASQQASFSRRQANTINFHSGNFAGFQVLASYSATDESTQITPGGGAVNKPRLYSIGATYRTGPLYVGAAYERHKNYNPAGQAFGTAAGQYVEGDDTAWQIVAAYTVGPVRLGASYHDKEYETADPAVAGAVRTLEIQSWALYADWRIAGPHTLRLGYVQADDTDGNSTANVNSLTAPVTAAGAAVGSTGAKLFLIQYAYAFSKRTEINIGYAKMDNETNSRHRLQSLARRNTCEGVAAGCDRDQDAIVLGVIHSF